MLYCVNTERTGKPNATSTKRVLFRKIAVLYGIQLAITLEIQGENWQTRMKKIERIGSIC